MNACISKFALLLIVATISLPSFAFAQETKEAQIQIADVPDAIRQLADRKFNVRKKATEYLASQGISVIKPLFESAVAQSPEVKWRALKIVELIGLAGDEDTFIKCAAILKTVSVDSTIDQKLDAMEQIWKSGQTKRAAENLRKFGATITLQDENVEFAQFIEFPGEAIEYERHNQTKSVTQIELSAEAVLSQIDKILDGGSSDNYKLAFPTKSIPVAEDSSLKSLERDALIEQQIFRQRMMMANGFAPNIGFGNSIELGKNWKGTPENFEPASIIKDVSTVTFGSIELDQAYIKPLQRMKSLRRLRLDNVKLDAKAIEEIARTDSIQSLEIVKTKIDRQGFAEFQKLKNLAELSIELDSESPGEFWDSLDRFRSLSILNVKHSAIDADGFEALEGMKSLSSITLEGCTFDIKKYRAFHQKHPQLIEFVPRAYMGVRAQTDLGQNSYDVEPCKIGEVIDGTGAANAGMKAGDIVKTIAGQEIETFQDLRTMVAQFKPDETVEVVIDRDSEVLTLKITLGDRSTVNQ